MEKEEGLHILIAFANGVLGERGHIRIHRGHIVSSREECAWNIKTYIDFPPLSFDKKMRIIHKILFRSASLHNTLQYFRQQIVSDNKSVMSPIASTGSWTWGCAASCTKTLLRKQSYYLTSSPLPLQLLDFCVIYPVLTPTNKHRQQTPDRREGSFLLLVFSFLFFF